jgi:hypothetical protein
LISASSSASATSIGRSRNTKPTSTTADRTKESGNIPPAHDSLISYTEQKRFSLDQSSVDCITTTTAGLRKERLSLALPEKDPEA